MFCKSSLCAAPRFFYKGGVCTALYHSGLWRGCSIRQLVCAYVHATPTTAPPSTASSTKAGAGGGPRVPICPGPAALCTTGADDGNYTPCPVPISRGHREESGGSCARPSTGGQRPPCSMCHTALASLADFPPAANKASRWAQSSPSGTPIIHVGHYGRAGVLQHFAAVGCSCGIRLSWSALRRKRPLLCWQDTALVW